MKPLNAKLLVILPLLALQLLIDACASRPSPEFSASTRKTGISRSRMNPIAFGIVQGLRGAPGSVSGGAS